MTAELSALIYGMIVNGLYVFYDTYFRQKVLNQFSQISNGEGFTKEI